MGLIDKVAIVAEIKRRIKTNKECMLGLRNLDYYQGKVDALNDTISSLDTLEVKEVDLEEEFADFLEKENAYIDDNNVISYYNGSSFNHTCDIYPLAKHFFELGMQVNNKA